MSYQLNRARLREFRLKLGWTQEVMAKTTGYSSRIIRKGEGTGKLSGATILDLIKAFNLSGLDVSPFDLVEDSLMLAARFFELLNQHQQQVLVHCSTMFEPDFRFACAGAPPIPFSGTFYGLDGFQQWLDLFFNAFPCGFNHHESPTFISQCDLVIVRFGERPAMEGAGGTPFWANFHLHVANGRFRQIEFEFDTYAVYKFLN